MRDDAGTRLATRVQLDLYDGLGWDLTEGSTNLYFITGREWVKVGLAAHPKDRVASLQVGCPFDLSIAHRMKIPRAFSRQVERHTHRRLRAFAARGEWFAVDLETAIAAASDIAAQVKALCSVMAPTYDGDWVHSGPRHTGADMIYLYGGIDLSDKRLLPF